MGAQKIAFVLACMACVGQGRRVQAGIRPLRSSRPAESRESSKSSGRTGVEDALKPLGAFAELLQAAHSTVAYYHPPGNLAYAGRSHRFGQIPDINMNEEAVGTRLNVARQFAVDVSDVIQPGRAPVDYVCLPAEKYNLLDSNAVSRLDGGSFLIRPGRQKIMLIGEVDPEASIRLKIGNQGVIQMVESIRLVPIPGKEPGLIARQMNKTIAAMKVSNTVAALPTGEITCRIKLDANFKQGLLAKAPEATLNKVMEKSLVQMLPWFLQQLAKDYAGWARGDETRADIAPKEMSKTLQQAFSRRAADLPPGIREINVQDQAAEELIDAALDDSSDEISLASTDHSEEPLLLRAARGERVERTPVWMMRQAGRHMAAYRALIDKYPTFRERSETPEVSKEISLQPWASYGTDGVILFSDILTPLPAMGVDFSISESLGIAIEPIRSREAFKRITEHGPFNPERDIPFVGSVLGQLREELDESGATVLGFVGLPFTLATYLIESNGTKTGFAEVSALRASDPELCHDILSFLAQNIAKYALYQIDSGAQVIQVFDSWAGHLEPAEFDKWAAPYQKQVVAAIKEQRPDVPVIIYMAPDTYSKNGQFLSRLAGSGADVVSVDHTIDIAEAKQILADAGYPKIGLQGNLDPKILRDGPPERILAETERILKAAGNAGHVMNLGHGIEATTPEQYAALFVNAVHDFKHSV